MSQVAFGLQPSGSAAQTARTSADFKPGALPVASAAVATPFVELTMPSAASCGEGGLRPARPSGIPCSSTLFSFVSRRRFPRSPWRTSSSARHDEPRETKWKKRGSQAAAADSPLPLAFERRRWVPERTLTIAFGSSGGAVRSARPQLAVRLRRTLGVTASRFHQPARRRRQRALDGAELPLGTHAAVDDCERRVDVLDVADLKDEPARGAALLTAQHPGWKTSPVGEPCAVRHDGCARTARGVLSPVCVMVARILRCYVALVLRVGATIAVLGGRLRAWDGIMSSTTPERPPTDPARVAKWSRIRSRRRPKSPRSSRGRKSRRSPTSSTRASRPSASSPRRPA